MAAVGAGNLPLPQGEPEIVMDPGGCPLHDSAWPLQPADKLSEGRVCEGEDRAGKAWIAVRAAEGGGSRRRRKPQLQMPAAAHRAPEARLLPAVDVAVSQAVSERIIAQLVFEQPPQLSLTPRQPHRDCCLAE